MSSWKKQPNRNELLLKKKKKEEKEQEIKDILLREVLEEENKFITKNEINPNEITIILQGIINSEIDLLDTIQEYKKYGKIILSIYEKFTPKELIDKIKYTFPDVVIVYNDLDKYELELNNYIKEINPQSIHNKNGYFQLKSIYNALQYVTTKYVIRTRVDYQLSNMNSFINCVINSNKICVLSLYVCGVNSHKCCLSDILFGSTFEIINNVLQFALKEYKNNISLATEIQLWKPYILSLLDEDRLKIIENNEEKYIDFISSIFYIFSLNRLHPYKIKTKYYYDKNIIIDDKNKLQYYKYDDISCIFTYFLIILRQQRSILNKDLELKYKYLLNMPN